MQGHKDGHTFRPGHPASHICRSAFLADMRTSSLNFQGMGTCETEVLHVLQRM